MRYFHLSIVLATFLLCSFSPGEGHSFEDKSQSNSLLKPDWVQTGQSANATLQKPKDQTTVVDNALKRLSETLTTADPSKAEDKNKIDDQLKELGLSDEDITKLTKELEKSKNPETLLKEFTDARGINPFSSASVEFAKSLQRALATPKTGALAPYQPLTEKPTNKENTGPTIPLKVNRETGAVSVTDRQALTDLINSKDSQTQQMLKDNGLKNLFEPNRTNAIQIGDHLVLPRDKAGNIQVLDPEQSKNWIQEQKQIRQDFLGMAKAGVSFPETTDAETGEKSRSLKIENPQEFLEKLRADPELLKAMDRQVNGLGANLLTQSLHEEALNLSQNKTQPEKQYLDWIQHNTNQAFIEANKGNRPSTDQNKNHIIIEETRPMLNALASMRQTEAVLENSGAPLTPDQKLKLAEAKALISNQLGMTSEDGRYGKDYRKTFQTTLGKDSDVSDYQALYKQVKNKGNDPEMPNLDLVTRLNTRDRVEKDLQEIISGKFAGHLDDLIKEAARASGYFYIDTSKGWAPWNFSYSKTNRAVDQLEAVQHGLRLSAAKLDRAQIAPDLAKQLRQMSGDLSNLHAVQANQSAEEYAAKVKTEIAAAAISLATLGAGQLLTLGARAIQVANGTAKAHRAFHLSKVSLFSLKDGAGYLGRNVLIGGSMGGSFYTAGAVAKYIDDSVKGKRPSFEFTFQDLGEETLKGSAIGGALGFSPAAGEVVGFAFIVLGSKAAAADLGNKNIAQFLTNIVGGWVATRTIQKIPFNPLTSYKQVPKEFAKEMVVSNLAQNYSGIWEKDKSYVLTQYLRDKIRKGLPLEEITAAEIRTINDNYKSLINYINPGRKPWTKEMQVKYFEELGNKSVAGTLWSADNNRSDYMFEFLPNSLIHISGVKSGDKILYHQTISVAYAAMQKMKRDVSTATIDNMGPELRKLFPKMLDYEIIGLLDVVKTLYKTRFLNSEPLYRVIRVFDGNPVTSIEGGIVASSRMPDKVATFLPGAKQVNVFRFEKNKFYSQVINGEGEVYKAGVNTWGANSCQKNEVVVFLPKNYTITKTIKKDGFGCFEPLPDVEYFYFRVTVP